MPLNINNVNNDDSVYLDQPDVYHKETIAVPAPERGFGVDTKNTVFHNIINAAIGGQLDVNSLQSFTSITQSRNTVYGLLDSMCEDATISAVLETYAEDATEYNDEGQIVWAESSDANIQKYVQFLLDTMNVDKNIYSWVYSLCKYGDVYLRLYRESDWKQADLFDDTKTKEQLNEDVKIKAYSQNDHYVNYMEMCPNPADIFELTKFGKTYAYINAPSNPSANNQMNGSAYQLQGAMSYKFKKGDVDLHGPMDYVHACLQDNTSRTPEKIQIFTSESEEDSDSLTYTVKRGQSLLYNVFKNWRELQLLESSILLNRVTKSSIIRMISVEVGDMPKEQVGPHLAGIKALIEQKAAIKVGSSISEYTNPGPIENNIYIPTHEGIGAITTSQIGGDVDVKSLADLEYYQDKLFGALRVPKQYFGVTGDAAGFDGGKSLSVISSRYGKMIKRIQNTMIQCLTDAINLMLVDRGLKSYVNEFNIRMLAPTTQEELDRRENVAGKVQLTSDIMNMLSDIEDTQTKLKILKSLLSNILTNGEVIGFIQDEIDKLEATQSEEESEQVDEASEEEISVDDTNLDTSSDTSDSILDFDLDGSESTYSDTDVSNDIETIEPTSDLTLPNGEDLGIDLTQNT